VTLRAWQAADNRARAVAVIEHFWPKLAAYGLSVGYDARRFVEPPFDVLIRSQPPSHRLELRAGRLVLACRWQDGQELVVEHFARGGWEHMLAGGGA
jgi:hypothetical protein